MGFLNNLGNELGSKTGKAIGNKLYGKYADDIRVGYGDSRDEGGGGEKPKGKITTLLDNSHESDMQQRQMMQEMEMKKIDQIQQLFDEVNSIEFDVVNMQNNINLLSKIVSIMESSYSDGTYEEDAQNAKLYDLASSKLDVGIAVLKSSDPNNSMAAFFEKKKDDIVQSHTTKRKKSKRKLTCSIVLAIIIIALMMLVAIVFG